MTWSPTCSWSPGGGWTRCRPSRCPGSWELPAGCWPTAAAANSVPSPSATGWSPSGPPPLRHPPVPIIAWPARWLSWPSDRELLMLIAWESLSVTEAAEVLGVRAGTVAVRLHRARQRFARALSAHDAPLNPMSEVQS
jgi:Sigma-70, region 4